MAYYGFADGASRHTRNLASAAWVVYSPSGELFFSGARCLGSATNNVAEYQAAIGLMSEALSSGITHLIVHLDSQLVVSQLNGIYSIRDPSLLRLFRRMRLLERSFVYIDYRYVPRRFNMVADSLANFMLDWYLSH
jgi:ribonuclease HI